MMCIVSFQAIDWALLVGLRLSISAAWQLSISYFVASKTFIFSFYFSFFFFFFFFTVSERF